MDDACHEHIAAIIKGLLRSDESHKGMWYEDPEPDLEFYLLFYSEKWARRMVESPRLRQLSWWLRNSWSRYLIVHGIYNTFIVAPMSIYSMPEDRPNIVLNCYSIALTTLTNTGLLIIITNKKCFHDLVNSLEESVKTLTKDDPHQTEYLRKTQLFCEAFTYYLHLTIVPVTWLAVLALVFFKLIPNHTLYYPQWHPVDWAPSPNYEIIITAHTMQVIIAVLTTNTLVTTVISSFLYIIHCFKIIHYMFENVREISLQSLLSRQSGTDVQLQVSTDVETPDTGLILTDVISTQSTEVAALNNGWAEHRALLNSLEEPKEHSQQTNQEPGSNEETVDPAVASLPAGITKQDLDDEMEQQLKRTIAKHGILLRSSLRYGSLLDVFLMVLFVVSTLILAGTVLILKVNDSMNLSETVFYLSISLQVMAFFMLFNYLSEVVTDESSALVEAVYFSDWLNASPRFKRSMLIAMARSTIPIEIKPTGLDPLSLRNFAQVSKTAYQMIATLENM